MLSIRMIIGSLRPLNPF
jgi:hypothetical protein